jgi:hypothetical protein
LQQAQHPKVSVFLELRAAAGHIGFGTLPPCRVTLRQAGGAFALYEFESL